MRRTLLLCVMVLCGLGVRLADPLEGTKWKVKVVPDEQARQAGEKDFEDVLSFKGSMFSTEYFASRGFSPAIYQDDSRRFGPATFTATLKHDEHGTARWSGMVAAVSIRGELVWTRKDGTVLNYSYEGERIEKK